ncbi:unnamed protein product [Peronospora destructor]|uniref:Uncharacterized protein n=1 Tax=Peronospora destructor TaxID=86335 RepID=A0AAV0UWG2_9STRA|nr:unnamed protein product [Peronospora destructor]
MWEVPKLPGIRSSSIPEDADTQAVEEEFREGEARDEATAGYPRDRNRSGAQETVQTRQGSTGTGEEEPKKTCRPVALRGENDEEDGIDREDKPPEEVDLTQEDLDEEKPNAGTREWILQNSRVGQQVALPSDEQGHVVKSPHGFKRSLTAWASTLCRYRLRPPAPRSASKERERCEIVRCRGEAVPSGQGVWSNTRCCLLSA